MESIRTARKQRDMTLAQVAEKTGLSISFLSDLERGRTDPSLSTLRRIAACYGVPVAYLLEEEGVTMSENVRVPVTEFFVSPSILFLCIFCGVANTERRHGVHHMSTGSHCDNCQAYYTLQWNDVPEQSIIEMTRADRQGELPEDALP
jgi:transcriptional regulator with XRE-family HTH domain